MIRIGAALFNGDHSDLKAEVARLEGSGVDFIHFDVFDGRFVPDLGFPPRTIEALRPLSRLPFEVHLGAERPERFAAPLAETGTDTVIFHVEAAPMLYETIFSFREHELKVGVALGLGTPIEVIAPVAAFVDVVLLLSRVTGEGTRGATYIPAVEPRLAGVRRMLDEAGSTAELQVAGGVNRKNIPAAVSAGARGFALGAGLYKVVNMADEVTAIRKELGEISLG